MLRVGTVLRGAYRIESYIASGGFGNTYKATNEFGETVAIKEFFLKEAAERVEGSSMISVSRSKAADFEAHRQKFHKEAQRMRALHSKHLVRIDALFEENGTSYYVMDYIDGLSLDSMLRRKGPMGEEYVWQLLGQILDALQTVHAEGIWHLDLKPGNIMIDSEGVVKLIDFGSSKQLNVRKGGATSSTGATYTPGYAPFEQVAQSFDKFGPWTDLYALGATLYRILSGDKVPDPVEIDDDPTPDKQQSLSGLAAVSPLMKELVLWLMKVKWRERPQSVAEVQAWLDARKNGSRNDIDEEKTQYASDEETIIEPLFSNNSASAIYDAGGQKSPATDDSSDGSTRDKGSIAIIIGMFVLFIISAIVAAVTCEHGGRRDSYSYWDTLAVDTPVTEAVDAPAEVATEEEYYWDNGAL